MPIISPNKAAGRGAFDQPAAVVTNTEHNPASAVRPSSEPSGWRNTLLALALLVGAVIPPGIYLWTNDSDTSAADQHTKLKAVDLSRYEKTADLAVLSERELEQNLVSLIEAKKLGDTVTTTALEIIVNKGRRDLEEAKQRLAQILTETHASADGGQVDDLPQLFDAAATAASTRGATDVAQMLKAGARGLTDVPANIPPQQYFRQVIDRSF